MPFEVDFALEHIALAGHRYVFTGRHREGSGQQPGQAGEEHNGVLDRTREACAGESHDKSGVGDQSVADPEDGGAHRTGLVRSVPWLATLGRAFSVRKALRLTALERSEHIRVFSLIGRHRGQGLGLVVVYSGVGPFVLLQGVHDGDQSQRSRPSHQLLVIGVEHRGRRRNFDTVGGEFVHPVLGVLVLDISQLQQRFPLLTVGGFGQGPI